MKFSILFLSLLLSLQFFCQAPPPPPVIPHVGDTVVGHPGVYKLVESMPEYPGGEDAMMKFIQKSIQYPDSARENDVQGRVVIGFIVNEDGSLSDITVRKSVSWDIDREALRVVKRMPKFKPGMQDGKPVRVQFTLPIMFKLITNSSKSKRK